MDTNAYKQLQNQAEALLKIVQRQARRGYVLEITGTPKAGKTTSIAMIENFFKTCGWRVHVLTERAALCPLKMKGHFFFNTWTTCTMLAEFLDLLDREIDLVILDRGFFDALVWLELQHARGQVSVEEYRVFQEFVLLDRWQLTDAVAILSVDPQTAMDREHASHILTRKGSIMQAPALKKFNLALEDAKVIWSSDGKTRPSLIDVNCEPRDQKATVAGLIGDLLPRIEAWADPSVAVIPRSVAEEIFRDGRSAIKWEQAVWDEISARLSFLKRSVVEDNDTYVQLVSCGATTYEDGVFVFKRSGSRPKLYGLKTVLHRCHVDAHDGESVTIEDVKGCLIRRLKELLHVQKEMQPVPLGFVWDAASPIETRHMGIAFDVPLEQAVAESLAEKEFKTNGRGHPMTSTFASPDELRKAQDLDLEPWSKSILADGWL